MSVIPVLMYHSISDDGQKMSVSKHNFYKQAKIMLKLGFKSVNLKDIFNDKSKRKFVITFDDGYQDVFTNAYPILKELNLKALNLGAPIYREVIFKKSICMAPHSKSQSFKTPI